MIKDLVNPRKAHKQWSGHHNHMGHRAIGKWKTGPGGMNCPCCTLIHPSKLKVKFARWNRRKAKQELNTLAFE